MAHGLSIRSCQRLPFLILMKQVSEPVTLEGKFVICFKGNYTEGDRDGEWEMFVIQKEPEIKYIKIMDQVYKTGAVEGIPHGIWKFYNLRGNLIIEKTMKDGLEEGLETQYFLNGNVIFKQHVKFGQRNGYYKEWNQEGNLILEGNYVNDLREGLFKIYRANGSLHWEIPYQKDIKHGLIKGYYEDGTLFNELTRKEGIITGVNKYFHTNGQLWSETIMKDGKNWEIIANYDKEGNPKEKGTLKRGNGTVYYYHEDGSLREIITYEEGEPIKSTKN